MILRPAPYLGSVLQVQVQLQGLVQVQLAVAPALQEVRPGPLQALQQRGHPGGHGLEVRPAGQPAAVVTAGVPGRLPGVGAESHALEKAPPLPFECVDGCRGNRAAEAAMFLNKSRDRNIGIYLTYRYKCVSINILHMLSIYINKDNVIYNLSI